MKSKSAIFGFLALTIALVIGSAYVGSTSALQSPLALPTFTSLLQTPTAASGLVFQSPLPLPTFRTHYVGKELVATQEAEYVIQVAATRRAAVVARTLTPMYPSTPIPTPVLLPSIAVVPTAAP